MYISGLQKLTLLDYPEHLAAILFLDGCNFRCPFCHNSGLVLSENDINSGFDSVTAEINENPLPESTGSAFSENKYNTFPQNREDLFSEDEVLGFLKKRAGMLDGVCISGGEPTLHRDLPDLIARIKELGYEVKLDTNGTNPDMLRRLLDDHLLDYIAMDIKAGRRNYAAAAGISKDALSKKTKSDPAHSFLSFEKDRSGPGCSFLTRIQRSIDIIRNSGIDYEFRTTVVKGIHTEEDFEDIAQWLAGRTPEFSDSAADLQKKDMQASVFASSQTSETDDSIAALPDDHTQMSASSGNLRYYLQSFRDCDTILLPNHSFSAFSEEEMLHFLSIIKKTIPNASLRGMEP